MVVSTVTYEDGIKVQGGDFFITDQKPLAADTYYPGMLLEYDATNDVMIALATDANLAGIYIGPERTLTGAGQGGVCIAGDIDPAGLVDDSNDALTITEDQRQVYRNRGFYIKRA